MFLKKITNLFRKRIHPDGMVMHSRKHPEGVAVRDTPLVVFIERVKAIRCFCVRVVNTLRVSVKYLIF